MSIRVDKNYVEALRARAGETLGVSKWITINRTEADAFRIVVRGGKSFGPPAETLRPLHTFHLMAMITGLSAELGLPIESDDHFYVLNYGFDEIVWGRPVWPGERLRAQMELLDITDKGTGRYLVRRRNIVEVEADSQPVLEAISCTYWVLR